MKLNIYLPYFAPWGITPSFELHSPRVLSLQMTTISEGLYCAQFELDGFKNGEIQEIEYSFKVGDKSSYRTQKLSINPFFKQHNIWGAWRDEPRHPELYSAAFKNIFSRPDSPSSRGVNSNKNLRLVVEYPYLYDTQRLALVGNVDALGGWDPRSAPRFTRSEDNNWSLELSLEDLPPHIEYKLVVVDRRKSDDVRWEDGPNRQRDLRGLDPRTQHTFTEGQPRLEEKLWRGSGLVVPLFSLRSEQSAGIGDFADLESFASWAASVGAQVIQLLPINDTTQTHTHCDSYPYSAISSFALHPLYLSLERMGTLKDPSIAHQIASQAERANSLDDLHYDAVDALKWDFFRAIYAQDGQATLSSSEFKKFFQRNREWLAPYALFCYLREQTGTVDFSKWGLWSTYDKERAQRMLTEDCAEYKEIGLHLFLQYHLDKQLRHTHAHCQSIGIALKGDIPIGVNLHSVECWTEPQFFNLDRSAGAPPDDFASEGQNWGFPTYNWQAMAGDNYGWWRRRFEKMADYFEMYRIDHILGFFRIWEIERTGADSTRGYFSPALPLSKEEIAKQGLPLDKNLFVEDPRAKKHYHPLIKSLESKYFQNGLNDNQRETFAALYEDFFYHRHNEFWAQSALDKLPALCESTQMLACAEDLGMIPASVGATLERLKMITLEIQRMPKAAFAEFADPATYPYRSVASTSTHDMPPLRLWWETMDETQRQRYYNNVLAVEGVAPSQASRKIVSSIVASHLASPSMLAILPLQDVLGQYPQLWEPPQNEQINIPADPNHYWRWRMKMNIAELQSARIKKISRN